MLQWISQHETLMTLLVQVVSAVVWIAYLQTFIDSLRRQRRSNILINRVAGNRDRAHLLIGNMGAEPIYVTAVIADLQIGKATESAIVTDRASADPAEDGEALSATNQGPLDSAQYRDMGSFREIIDKALSELGRDDAQEDVTGITVTVAAEGTHDGYLVAGQNRFRIRHRDGQRIYLPQGTHTRQIRSRSERKQLSKRLQRALDEEARACAEPTPPAPAPLASVAA